MLKPGPADRGERGGAGRAGRREGRTGGLADRLEGAYYSTVRVFLHGKQRNTTDAL